MDPERWADLACPLCGGVLAPDGGSARCPQGHAFDVARQGYVAFLVGRGVAGDTGDMVAARERFLARGHYDPVVEALAETAPDHGLAVDVAGGTGHHLAGVLGGRPGLRGVVLDSSTAAVRRAARAHPRLVAASADAWSRLPVPDGAAALLLSVFGPRNADEMARVAEPGATLLVVTPRPEHLAELREGHALLGIPAGKADALAVGLEGFEPLERTDLIYHVVLRAEDVADEVLMGPNAHHVDADDVRARAVAAGTTEATVAVTLSRFRARDV